MSQFYSAVIVRRARERSALAARIRGAEVPDSAIGRCQSPLTRVQRRALAAQVRVLGTAEEAQEGMHHPNVGWNGWVAQVVTGARVLDPVIVAQAKVEAKTRRAAWRDLQTVASAQYGF